MASGCFDRLAANYDREWTNAASGRLQRAAVSRRALTLFHPGESVLDLGCGTGADATALAAAGVQVTAIDASPEMIRIARAHGVNAKAGRIEDIDQMSGTFDGVISNFGAMNCVQRPGDLRATLSRLVRPGGLLAICWMGRFCLWETLFYLADGQPRKAARRWRGRTYSASLSLHVHYHSARRLRRALLPEFAVSVHAGIGLSVPPSYVHGIAPRWLERFDRIDRRIAHLPGVRGMADHQLLVFVRQ